MDNLINSRILNENVEKPFTPNDVVMNEDTSIVDIKEASDKAVGEGKIGTAVSELQTGLTPDPVADELKDSTLTESEMDELRYGIENSFTETTEIIADGFNEVDRIFYESVNDLEALSIKAIHSQYKIITECGYGSDEYNEEIQSLTESTVGNIFASIISWIKQIVEKAKKVLSDIGIKISIQMVNYTKFVTENEKVLMEKADKYGDKVEVLVHDYSDDLMKSINFGDMYNVVDDCIKDVDSKDEMKKIVDKITSKYPTSAEFSNACYCKAFEELVSSQDIKVGKFTDRKLLMSTYKAKLVSNEYTKHMKSKRTSEYIMNLKNFKSRASQVLSTTRHTINPEFERLRRNLDKEMRSVDDNSKIKSIYYKLRYTAMAGVQEAVNAALKIKVDVMTQYAKEMYRSLDKLLDYKEESMNESVVIDNNEYVNYTLHA